MDLDLIVRPCPLCGSIDESRVFSEAHFDFDRLDAYAFASRKIPEYMRFRLMECAACDLVYASPVPADVAIAQAYRDAKYDSAEEARWAAHTYFRRLEGMIHHLPDRNGALDIGAGDGAFLENLLAAGFTDVCGIEPSVAPVLAAKKSIRSLIRLETFRPGVLAAGTFSLVTCFQTLEHISDPFALCKEAFRLLKPGGAMLIVCHNRRSVSAKILGRHSPIFDIEHLQLFSRRSGQKLLMQAGLDHIQVSSLWNCYPLHYWCRLFPLPRICKRPLIAMLKLTSIGFVPLALPGGNMILIGFKSLRGG